MSLPSRVHLAQATAADVPAGRDWLTGAEADLCSGMRFPHRVASWRLGRWTAKRAVAAALGRRAFQPERIEVLASIGGAPSARILEERDPTRISVSLSHSGEVGFAAATLGQARLGCDVETLDERSDAFVADYFTNAEQRWIEADRNQRSVRANLLWSAKESALKALGEGLRLDTRSVEVQDVSSELDADAAWRTLAVRVPEGRVFPGWWRIESGKVWTVVAEVPIRLA